MSFFTLDQWINSKIAYFAYIQLLANPSDLFTAFASHPNQLLFAELKSGILQDFMTGMKKMTAQTEDNFKFSYSLFFLFFAFFALLLSDAVGQVEIGYKKQGKASFYAKKFQGMRTSNGERYHSKKMTAAHRSLPFGTLVKVTNLRNGKSVVVRINDRGPFVRGRLIDVSHLAATELELVAAGTAPVEMEVIGTDASSPELDTETMATVSEPLTPKKLTPASIATKPQPHALPESATPAAVYQPGKIYTIKGVVTTTRGFGVQVGAFQQFDNAAGVCKNLVSREIRQVYILVENIKDSKTFCVVAGTFKKRKDAEAFIVSLKEQGFSNGFVKKYSN